MSKLEQISSSKQEQIAHQVGFVLSGGGSRGFAHLGAIKALHERGLFPDYISGTSAGAFSGCLLADGYSPEEIISFFDNRAFNEFGKLMIPRSGLFSSVPFYRFLHKHLRSKTFADLKIQLSVTATNLEKGKPVTFSEGLIVPPVVASCSVPIIFKPVKIDGEHYVDGGLFKNFPVSPIRKHCRFIVGINVTPLVHRPYKENLWSIAEQSFHYMFVSNTLADKKACDLLIEIVPPDEKGYSMFDLNHTREIYELGYETAKAIIDRKLNDIENIVAWQTYYKKKQEAGGD
ncbi:MAG: hypothetical protein BGN96_02800 [Bacteroidales bacterium 45-6]|nr:MAG: hypothetical protein BGN96_02800 [Bacteroidales bacterium 45-6]